jgi:heme/copper-type cytochrome/quinol oxidase subunit 2
MAYAGELQAVAAVKNSFVNVVTDAKGFLELAGLPILATAILSVFFGSIVTAIVEPDASVDGDPVAGLFQLLAVLGSILALALSLMFMVAWYRRYLSTGPLESGWKALRWDRTRTRFLFRMLMIAGILLLTIVMGLTFLESILGAIGFPPAAVLLACLLFALALNGRLILILPATAVDNTLTLRESWNLTKGLTGRMMMVMLLPVAPVLIVILGVTSVLGQETMEGYVTGKSSVSTTLTGSFLFALARETLAYAWYAIQVGAIADAYRQIKDRTQV